MRGTSPAARKQQRYVAPRTRFVGFARRGPICMISSRVAGSDSYRTSIRHGFDNLPIFSILRSNCDISVEFLGEEFQFHTRLLIYPVDS